MSSVISYSEILKSQSEFKRSGTNSSSDFNKYDFQNHKYFKILFHFGDVDVSTANTNLGHSNGLLHPTWEIFASNKFNIFDSKELYNYNSAWSYLHFNGEYERARKLKDFIITLSNINSYSPWYFNSISGIDAALERKYAADMGKLDMNERKVLSIQCLPDSFDNRIQTLLELYRDVTWSWIHKREILPANLRKFDMSILIFESPLAFWHEDIMFKEQDGKNTLTPVLTADNINNVLLPSDQSDTQKIIHSYKLIEFHDCEFNFNSLKSGFNQVNNKEGFSPTYTIDISYADCYEESFNEFMSYKLGDINKSDMLENLIDTNGYDKSDWFLYCMLNFSNYNDFIDVSKQQDKYLTLKELHSNNDGEFFNTYYKLQNGEHHHNFGNLEEPTFKDDSSINRRNYDSKRFSPGFVTNAAGQVIEQGKKWLMNNDFEFLGDKSINDIRLGNLYEGTSISGIRSFASNLLKGNVMGSSYSIKDYIDDKNKQESSKSTNTIDLGSISEVGNMIDDNQFEVSENNSPQNIFKSNKQTIAAAKINKANNLFKETYK